MGLRYLWAVLAGGGLMATLILWRGFPFQLAFFVGIGGAALVYTSFGALERVRRLHRQRPR